MEIQRLLQEEENESLELTLISRENNLIMGFESLFNKVSKEVKKIRAGVSTTILEVENVIQTSFTTLPKKVKMIKNLPHTIPSFILQNIQVYEGIISTLYNHPCYFYKMLKSDLIEKNTVLDWICKIYGSQLEDDRSINHVLTLGIMLLEDEVEIYKLQQQSVIILMSCFAKLYHFIQEYQKENINFIKEIAQHLLGQVGVQITEEREKEREMPPMINKVPTRSMFDVEDYIKHHKKADEKVGKSSESDFPDRCLKLLENFELHLKSVLSRLDFAELGKMSPQIRYFNNRIIEEYKKEQINAPPKKKKHMPDLATTTKLAELLVMNLFFGKLPEVILNYKEYGVKVPIEHEDILSPENLQGISLLITKYFQKEVIIQDVESFDSLNNFITASSKKAQVVDELIKGMISSVNTNITAQSLLRTVEDSLSLKEKYVYKLTVKDIINIQNFVITNRNNTKVILKGSEDPLYILTEPLKDFALELSNFSFDVLAYKVTLKVNSK